MKTATPGMAAHIAEPCLTLATCWRVARTDGTVMGFTDHDQDLVVDLHGSGFGSAELYEAATGYARTAIQNSANLAVDNLDLEGLLDSERITKADLRAGKYDQAQVWVFAVNWADLSHGILRLRRGWLGNTTLKKNTYVAELRGLAQIYANNFIEVCTPECRADLGDARCTVDVDALKESASVETVASLRQFTVPAATLRDVLTRPANGYGLVKWTSGANLGVPMEVKTWAPETLTVLLFLPMSQPIEAGDTFDFYPRCDKSLTACKAFSNVINFQGEPYVPGTDSMLAPAGTQ